jgi:hypothetical protein
MRKSKIGLIKHSFFANSLKVNDNFSFNEDDFDLDQVQAEFASLDKLFISNKNYWFKERPFISYMYYLNNLLIRYYQFDYVNVDLQKLKERKKQIDALIKEHFSLNEQELIKQFSTNDLGYNASLISISTIRQHVSTLNTNRSHWGYSRALANHAITFLQNNCPNKNTALENQCVSADIINLLNQSREPLIILGLSLFTLRFFINMVLMIKHIINAAYSKELSSKKVLKQELEKRGFTMANDLAWAIASVLTNYHIFFHIAASAVSPIIGSFLAFDALLFIAQWSTETTKYNKRLQELITQEKEATDQERALIKRQIDLLNDEWEVQCAYYLINIFAANLIVISFGISLLCTGPLALAGLAIFCSLGNALYNTLDEFNKYQRARIAIQRELANGSLQNDANHQELIELLNKECEQAATDFWKFLAFNVGGTAFIITAAVISWPVALSLTLLYAAYRLNNVIQNKLDIQGAEKEINHDIYRIFNGDQSEDQAVLSYQVSI